MSESAVDIGGWRQMRVCGHRLEVRFSLHGRTLRSPAFWDSTQPGIEALLETCASLSKDFGRVPLRFSAKHLQLDSKGIAAFRIERLSRRSFCPVRLSTEERCDLATSFLEIVLGVEKAASASLAMARKPRGKAPRHSLRPRGGASLKARDRWRRRGSPSPLLPPTLLETQAKEAFSKEEQKRKELISKILRQDRADSKRKARRAHRTGAK